MNEHETIADIIAEMRGIRVREFQDYADRLEAAWKRERAKIEADALAVGGIVEAAHRRELSKNASKNEANFGQLSDCAKLREALESIASNLEHRLFARYPSSASDEWMYQKANTALAATEKEGGNNAD